MIVTLKELQISDNIILKQICMKFHLTEEAAKAYLEKKYTILPDML